jgi:purine-binding chemotaxis protein CheW
VAETETTTSATVPTDSVRKYLIFSLAGEDYGVSISKIREIIGYTQTSPVPGTPDHVKGVLELRDRIIPIVDLRLMLGQSEAEPTDATSILILGVGTPVGIIIDAVQAVDAIRAEDIEPPSDVGIPVDVEALSGMCQVDGRRRLLLDIDRLLHGDDVVRVLVAATGTRA